MHFLTDFLFNFGIQMAENRIIIVLWINWHLITLLKIVKVILHLCHCCKHVFTVQNHWEKPSSSEIMNSLFNKQ